MAIVDPPLVVQTRAEIAWVRSSSRGVICWVEYTLALLAAEEKSQAASILSDMSSSQD